MKTAARLLLLAVGLALFAWFVQRAGVGEIWRTCAKLGWLAPLALLPYAVIYLADTLGWRFAFPGHTPLTVGFWRLYRIRLCGESVNNVVPSAYIGGESVKVYLLHQQGVSAGPAAASVIVGRTLQTLTQVLFIALGAAAFLSMADPGSGVRRGMVFVLASSLVVVAGLFWLQSHGMFSVLFRVLSKLNLRVTSLESKREKLEQIDRRVVDFYRNDRRRFALSAGSYFAGWLLDTMDIYLVAWLLGMPIGWPQAMAVEAFVSVAKILGLFVPGALGVQESGIALVCRLAGLPDALGLAYAIIRRGRDVVYASLGWLLLYLGEATLKGLPARVATEPNNP
jgi:putative membrane protein